MSKVLLVEDDYLVRETTVELLEVSGLEVIAAESGQQALAAVNEADGSIDLVILDLTLPDMSGEELLAEIVNIQPDIRVVICSGALPDEISNAQHQVVKGVLGKPFDLGQLREVIKTALA